jgi:hypothetical protein
MRLAKRVAILAVVAFVVAAPAQARRTSNPALFVNFFTDGTIAMTLADGTPVGSTSGTPTVIPAGYYTMVFSGPGGCSALPNFKLSGPGMNLVATMYEGAMSKGPSTANFAPSATYAWIDDAFPSVVHTFSTSSEVVGTPPPTTTTKTPTPRGKPVTSNDVVGSQVARTVGTIAGSVNAAGRLAIAFKGKSVGSLKAGRYTIAVKDTSSKVGFSLRKSGQARTIVVTQPSFLGRHSVSVKLTAGRWLFTPSPGKPAFAIKVR